MNARLLRQWFLVLFLLLLLAIPFVQLIWPVTDTNENRVLAPLPEQPSSSEQLAGFPKAFESYMDDNFGFRRLLQRASHRISVAMGSSPLKKVLLGDDGWLYSAHLSLTDQHRGAMFLDDVVLDEYVDAFHRQRLWIEGQGVDYFLMPLPDKNTIYPEFLPDWAQAIRPGRFAQVRSALLEADEPFVDSLPLLMAAKNRGEWIYWQTDTHWNCLGAFHAYQVLMDAIDASGVSYRKRVTYSELRLEARPPSKGGDMSQMLIMEDILLEHRDVGCGLVLNQHVPFTAERLSDGVIRDNHIAMPRHEIWRYVQDVPVIESKALIYRDSFALLLLPYLVKTFDEVVVVPHGELEFDKKHFEEHQPDLVIYQFSERDLLNQPDRTGF